jgi:hypothetical protein
MSSTPSRRDRPRRPGPGPATWLLGLCLIAGTLLAAVIFVATAYLDPTVDVRAAGGPVALVIDQFTGTIPVGPWQVILLGAFCVLSLLVGFLALMLVEIPRRRRAEDLLHHVPPPTTTTTDDPGSAGDVEDRWF